MIDYCEKLKQDLIQILNENPLDLSIKYYVCKDFLRDVEISLQNYKMQLMQEENQEYKKENEEKEISTATEVEFDIPKEMLQEKINENLEEETK